MSISDSLARTLLELVSIPSPIGEEGPLCDYVAARLSRSLGAGAISRYQQSLVVRANEKRDVPRIGLVGHLDTVRTDHDGPPRIEEGRLYGAGAADMKSGLAAMIELVERTKLDALPCDLTLVFYEREEGPFDENVLGPLLENYEVLRSLDLAICLEPSDNKLQLGCLGSVHASVIFHGRTAHSARPWQGENAIVKSASFLADLGNRLPVEHVIDGLKYSEVITPTLANGGRGRNVVPDRFELNVNYRFAPGRTPDDAIFDLEQIAGGRAEVVPRDKSPSGLPHSSHPLVRRLKSSGVRAVESKQAWTDVARFDSIGVPAVNFGPGTQAQAHQRNEYTELGLLEEGYQILQKFLGTLSPI